MGQCNGITKNGRRCRIILADDGIKYCRYHKTQDCARVSVASARATPKTNQSTVSGYIYIFTLAHLISPKPRKQGWLRIAEPSPDNVIDYTRSSEFRPKHDILIKVGYTSITPLKRLRQWKDHCKQHFVLLTPDTLSSVICSKRDKMECLIHEFRGLKLGHDYSQFDYQKCGFRTERAYDAEQKIHKILRKGYGFGKLYCDGCKTSSSGVHKEWFLVPRKDIKLVF
ncbi:DEKNAAC105646, partial [Brettanomyces naardenensis]